MSVAAQEAHADGQDGMQVKLDSTFRQRVPLCKGIEGFKHNALTQPTQHHICCTQVKPDSTFQQRVPL